MNKLVKLLGGLILLFGVLIFSYSYRDVVPFLTDSPAERLESLWERDVISLTGSTQLPQGFYNLKEITYNPVSEKTKAWLKEIQPPFSTKKEGTHRLEVLLDDWKDEGDFGVMVQYQLVDLGSGDTVWELGRTLTLGKEPKH